MNFPPAATVAIIVIVVALAGYFVYRAASPAAPTADVTPGLPPWKDPKFKGKLQPGQNPNDWRPPAQSAPAPTGAR